MMSLRTRFVALAVKRRWAVRKNLAQRLSCGIPGEIRGPTRKCNGFVDGEKGNGRPLSQSTVPLSAMRSGTNRAAVSAGSGLLEDVARSSGRVAAFKQQRKCPFGGVARPGPASAR